MSKRTQRKKAGNRGAEREREGRSGRDNDRELSFKHFGFVHSE